MAKRKSPGKRKRFEIFKRDGFKCAYCGRSPPEVLLHVDHIVAVANGGTDDPTNLITACADCNLGKSSVPLTSVAPSLKRQAEEAAERADQLRAYTEMVIESGKVRDDIARSMFRAYSDSLEWPDELRGRGLIPGDLELATMRTFSSRLPAEEILDAANIVKGAAGYKPGLRPEFVRDVDGEWKVRNTEDRWRYFCGVCWKKIRAREGQA